MSTQTSNVFATQMTNLIKPIYLDEAKLGTTIRKQSGVIGGTYEFLSGGYNCAKKVALGASVIANNTKYNKIKVVLDDWAACDYSSIFDKPKITFDELSYLSKSIGGALGRTVDQVIIDAINAVAPVNSKPTVETPHIVVIKGDGTFPSVPTEYVANDRVPFSLNAIKKASSIMNSLGVPASGRFLVVTPECVEALLGDATVTSADYNTIRALVDGSLDTYVGFKIISIGQRPEGGLPTSTYTTGASGSTAFAFHTEALGLAMGMEPKVHVNYVAEKRSWLVDGVLSLGAGVIDKNGIIKIIHGTT